MKAKDIILKPIITEKATLLVNNKTYSFWINKKATKIDVKRAIKSIYGAEVDTVRTSYQRSKDRMLRKGPAQKRPELKKAYVTLKNKASLDFTRFEKESTKDVKVTTKKAAKPVKEKAAKEVKTTKKTTK